MQLLSSKSFRKSMHKNIGRTFFKFIVTDQEGGADEARPTNRPVNLVERLPLRHSVLTNSVYPPPRRGWKTSWHGGGG